MTSLQQLAVNAMSVEKSPSIVLSSQDLSDRDPVGAVESVMRQAVMSLHIEPSRVHRFSATMKGGQVGFAGLFSWQMSPGKTARNRLQLQDGKADYCLIMPRTKPAIVKQGDDALLLKPGQATLLRQSELTAVNSNADIDLDFGVVMIPHAEMLRRITSPDEATLHRLDAASSAFVLLRDYAHFVDTHRSTASQAELELMGSHLIDLAALSLKPVMAANADVNDKLGVKAARLQRAMTDIQATISDPTLSAGRIAAMQGISQRYLQILFEETGQTFSSYVLAMRLDLARNLLRNASSQLIKIAEVAERVGFSEATSFNRAYRRRFGETPSDTRKAASIA